LRQSSRFGAKGRRRDACLGGSGYGLIGHGRYRGIPYGSDMKKMIPLIKMMPLVQAKKDK